MSFPTENRMFYGLNPQLKKWTADLLRNRPGSLYNYIEKSGEPIPLEQAPGIPEMPSGFIGSTGEFIPYNVPEPQGEYIYVSDQHSTTPSWQRIGEPIPENMRGQRGIGDSTVWGPENHNANLPNLSRMSDSNINEQLQEAFNQPIDGSREERLQRLVRAQARGPIQEGDPYGLQAARTKRGLPTTSTPPARGNLANTLRSTPSRTGPGFGGNAMTMSELESGGAANAGGAFKPFSGLGRSLSGTAVQGAPTAAAETAATGAAEAGGLSSAMGTAGTFAARANPVLMAAMMGYQLYNMMDSENKAKEAEKQQKEMRL